MIESIRHKGLKAFIIKGKTSGIEQSLIPRLRRCISVLDAIATINDLKAIPRYRLHPLRGDLKGYWAIWVSGNWRLIFRFEDGRVFDLDLVDYH